MKKFYLVDIIGDGSTIENARKPFFGNTIKNWSAIDGGNLFLVEVDANDTIHAQIESDEKAILVESKNIDEINARLVESGKNFTVSGNNLVDQIQNNFLQQNHTTN